MISLMGSDAESRPVDPSRFKSSSLPGGTVLDLNMSAIYVWFIQISKECAGPRTVGEKHRVNTNKQSSMQ